MYQPSFYPNKQIQPKTQCSLKSAFSPVQIIGSSCEQIKLFSENEISYKLQKQSSLCERLQTQQDEYVPKNSSDKKMRKNQQNENRNIIPNIINQILSYLQKKNKSHTVTSKILQKLNSNPQYTLKRFYLYQSILKNKISHYVNQDTMRIFKKTHNIDLLIFDAEQQIFYNQVSRILIFHFLNTQAQTSTLTSKRMDKSKKSLHIQTYRELQEKIKELYKNN